MNLEAFFPLSVDTIHELNEFHSFINNEVHKEYNIVLTYGSLGNTSITNSISNYCIKNLPDSNLIIMGDQFKQNYKKHHHIKSYHDINSLLNLISLLIQTPISISPLPSLSEYFPLPIHLLKNMTFSRQDLWIPSDKKSIVNNEKCQYHICFKKGEVLDQKIIDLILKTSQYLYVKSEFKIFYVICITNEILNNLSNHINDVKSISSSCLAIASNSINVSIEIFSHVFNTPSSLIMFNEKNKSILTELAKSSQELIDKVSIYLPSDVNKLIMLFKKGNTNIMQEHTLMCSYFCLIIAKSQGWYNRTIHYTLELLCFFHDIMLTPIYHKHSRILAEDFDFIKINNLSENEKMLITYHPKEIAHYFKHIPDLPMTLEQLLLHHHGNTLGVYDNTLQQEEISSIAKLFFVAEEVSEKLLSVKTKITHNDWQKILEEVEKNLKKASYKKYIQPLKTLSL